MEEQLCNFSEGKNKRRYAVLYVELTKDEQNRVCKEGLNGLSNKRLECKVDIENYYVR